MRTLFTIALMALQGYHVLHASAEGVWEELTPMPEGRSGMIAFINEDSAPAYFGGSSWNKDVKQIHTSGFSLGNGMWLPLDSLEKPLAYATVASRGTQLFAAGGMDGDNLHPSILVVEANSKSTRIEINPSQARIYAGGALIVNAFYQIGGSTELSPLRPTAAISKWESDSWTEVAELPEGPLINPATVTWKNSILIFGGGIPQSGGLKNTDAVYAFETSAGTWTKRGELPAPSRGSVVLSIPDVGVIVVGGSLDQGFSSQVVLFNPENNVLIPLANLPVGLLLPALVSNGKWVYVFGGEDAAKHRSPRVFRAGLSELIQSRGK
ncbi:MAG: hypothetical protein O3C20_07890 [Verrucomicrobia bacterium]|nr:hypothetical protein [Verrucomicrobiota bacterium]